MSDHNVPKREERRGTLNRRDFLRNASALAGIGLLAACAPAVQPAGDSSAGATAAGAERQKVRYLSWWFEEGNRGETWNNFIDEFNEAQSEIEVVGRKHPIRPVHDQDDRRGAVPASSTATSSWPRLNWPHA